MMWFINNSGAALCGAMCMFVFLFTAGMIWGALTADVDLDSYSGRDDVEDNTN